MHYTLQNFYKSDAWRNLRLILMAERENADGFIFCEKCGKPILKKYDCIAHHKKPLSDANVNDASVSLNPENIELIHFKCHNEEHQRFNGFCQKVYLVYGSPCSGKTSYVNEVANGDDLILDVDRIWDCICNGGRYKKEIGESKRPNRVRADVFAVRDCLIECIKMRKGKWRNAFIIGGYPLKTERDRLCDMLKAEPIYIESTLEDCLARAKEERPEAWIGYINDWFSVFVPD